MRFTYALATLMAMSGAAMPMQGQGLTIVQKVTDGNQSFTTRIQLDKDHMRSETRTSGQEMVTIFDGPQQVLRVINVSKKTYTEMSKADLDQRNKQLEGAMAQMQQQLQNLSPQQREMMEKMMQGRGIPGMRGMPSAPPKVEYKQTGTDKVAQWNCTKYEGTANGQKVSELCTVDPKEFGLAPGDFAVAQQFAEFMKALLPPFTTAFVNGTPQEQGFTGVPVRSTSYKNGAVQSTSEVTEMKKEAIPASAFETPAGFRKETGLPPQ